MRASLSAFCPTRFLLASCRRYCRNSPFSSVLSDRPVLLSVHSPSCFLTSRGIHLSKGPGRKCSPIPPLVTNRVMCSKGTCGGRAVLSRSLSSGLARGWGCAASPRVTGTFPRASVPWNRQAGSARSRVFLNPCWQIRPPCLHSLHVLLPRDSIVPRRLCFTMFAFLPRSRSSGRQTPPSSVDIGCAKLGRHLPSSVGAEVRSLPLESVGGEDLAVLRSPVCK